jgi:outer membrane receptor protein involved in Fe transport
MTTAHWLVGAYYANDDIVDGNRTLLGQNANVTLIRTVGQPLLATPFNCCGYTPADLSQAFRSYEDIGHIETRTWSVLQTATGVSTERLRLNAGLRTRKTNRSIAAARGTSTATCYRTSTS